MGALIQVGMRKAILRQGEWRCCDMNLEHHLNHITEQWVKESGGPSLDTADPDYIAAQAIARLVNGRVLAHVPARTRIVRHVWFAQRQYHLFGTE